MKCNFTTLYRVLLALVPANTVLNKVNKCNKLCFKQTLLQVVFFLNGGSEIFHLQGSVNGGRIVPQKFMLNNLPIEH